MKSIDLNADVGEGCAHDAALLEVVTSANIACGWHAGDRATMETTVRRAIARGVAIGAHPSFPDRAGFGRALMRRSSREVYEDVAQQVRALDEIVRAHDVRLRHVKPHGALYAAAARERNVADAISRAVRDVDARLAVVGLAGGAQIASAVAFALQPLREGFADRAYRPDGTLVPRDCPGALIEELERACAQAVALAEAGEVQTICIHGDGPQALAFAFGVRAALETAGVAVRSPFSA
jgi:UPF0271 protein